MVFSYGRRKETKRGIEEVERKRRRKEEITFENLEEEEDLRGFLCVCFRENETNENEGESEGGFRPSERGRGERELSLESKLLVQDPRARV